MPEGRIKYRNRCRSVLFACALAALALTGCHTLRFEIVDAPHTRIVHHQKSFFFAGLLPRQKRVDVSRFCPHGVSRVREQTTSDDAVIGMATLGVWTPRSSWYYCLPGPGEGSDWVVDVPVPGLPDPPANADDEESME